ncbi:MAG: ATP-binding protein, partial [Tepidiformaceae bacterium]
ASETLTLTDRAARASSNARSARLIIGGLAALVLLSTVGILVLLWRAFRVSAVDARAVLDHSDARYRVLSEALPQIIWTAKADGALDYFNDRWFEYSGMDYASSAGSGWAVAVHADDLARCLERWNNSLATGAIYEMEFRLRRADGAYLWHLARALPLGTAQGARSWFGTCTEIDRQKQTEAQLLAANQVKDEFLSMVSHELRTPLVVIVGNANLLREREQALSRDERRTAYEDLSHASKQLQARVENMLIVSRHEIEGSEEPEPVLVQRVANAVVAECRIRFPQRTFTVEIAPGLPPVGVNAGHLEQILQNLLGNAEKYGGPGPIEVTAVALESEVVVRVMDRGPGIDEADQPRLFEPFFRASATAKSASGIGLGLAVCQRLVEFQGGRIWVRSRSGGGTEFGFAFPVYVHQDSDGDSTEGFAQVGEMMEVSAE